LVEPATPENVSFAQTVHAALPISILNVAGTHARHGPSSGPVYPLLHRHKTLDPADCEFAGHDEQAEIDAAPVTLENVFAGQFTHSAEPMAALYVPGAHREHGPPFAPVAPVLQVQAVTAELLTTELELPGQLKHRSDEFAPGVPE
jgi:hypothetical protein